MEVGASAFRGFADLIELQSIEVYGEPSDEVVERLREKAQALGETGRVAVRARHAGFARPHSCTCRTTPLWTGHSLPDSPGAL